jgi:hypothetical protein
LHAPEEECLRKHDRRATIHAEREVDLPGAGYNLTLDKRRAVCQWLWGVKVPMGFSSNIQSLISTKDLTMTNYNSHDCHVMLTVFLLIVIRAIGPEYVKMVITRMSYFFSGSDLATNEKYKKIKNWSKGG